MPWIEHSYPGAEALWPLPGPSLCYVPSLHGLPDPQLTTYQEPKHHVFGSFNHTRKLTRATQERFGALLAANPEAVLQFRSHSFRILLCAGISFSASAMRVLLSPSTSALRALIG